MRTILIAVVLIGLVVAGTARAAERDARRRKFSAENAADAAAWQRESRKLLFELMKLSDLVEAQRKGMAFQPAVLGQRKLQGYTWHEMQVNSTPGRRISLILTIPDRPGRFPAIVCIHGHGGSRNVVYEEGIYHAFAQRLAENGFVTISTDVGQHQVYETGRTLMGERLWDVMRCVSYLAGRSEVDPERIGCAGLSLGGEMAMWLGAMDQRVKATVSSGYLTTVANMRRGHCPCWEFDGLTENFDWADIYSLIAPRALMCQIGRKESAPGGFPVDIATGAMREIERSYAAFGRPAEAVLHVHGEGHVFDLEAGMKFLSDKLKGGARAP